MNKPLHIIIDGPDKVGKTTVIKILADRLSLPIIKMPNMKEYINNEPSEDTAEKFSKLFNETIVQFKDTSFILDRGFTSSLVYSKVFNRRFDLSYIDKIEDELKTNVFILTGSKFEDDDIYYVEDVRKVEDEFIDLAISRGYHIISNGNLTPDGVADKIINLLV